MPSIVLTSAPSACTARTVQLLTASPSRCTVHAPQLVVSQPTWVPVRPRVSRSRCTSSSRGSTSTSCCWPFTVRRTGTVLIPLLSASDAGCGRAYYQSLRVHKCGACTRRACQGSCYGAASPSTMRSAASAARSTSAAHLVRALPPAPQHVRGDDVGIGRVRAARRRRARARSPASRGPGAGTSGRCGPPARRPSACAPRRRAGRSRRAATSTRSSSRCSAPRAGPAELPASFM